MRVLWFVEKPLPAVARRQGQPPIHHAAWLDQYESALRGAPGLTLGIAAPTQSPYEPFDDAGVTYYGLPSGESTGYGRVAGRWRRVLRPDVDLGQSQRVVDMFRPDLMHVHGFEWQYGLLAARGAAPTVISIQGILTVYELMDIRGMGVDLLLAFSPALLLRGTGTLLDYVSLRRSAGRERQIIQQCRHFIGRTRWDADVVRVLNPNARYYHCDELLRPEFRASVWDQARCAPRTVFCTMGGYARKGLGTLLKAVAILREGACPDVRLRVTDVGPGDTEGKKAAARQIRRLGLYDCVTVVGWLDSSGLARELLDASVFACPTHIDNSSNSLAEALMVGTPCVASAAGGIPTLARDGVEALLVQDGDPYALAGAILRLFEDKTLAQQLSQGARAAALRRHDPETVRETLLAIYRTVLDDERCHHHAER